MKRSFKRRKARQGKEGMKRRKSIKRVEKKKNRKEGLHEFLPVDKVSTMRIFCGMN